MCLGWKAEKRVIKVLTVATFPNCYVLSKHAHYEFGSQKMLGLDDSLTNLEDLEFI